MENYKITELADFINAINKKTDAAIEVSVGGTSGFVGAIQGGGFTVKITPPAPVRCKGAGKCKSDKTE